MMPRRKRKGRARAGSLLVSLLVSLTAGALLYGGLALLVLRPLQRVTRSMERFAADPESEAETPSDRHDEIGRVERELARMQEEVRQSLRSRARLVALGEAVAKINHDLRNMLTSAQIASDRLAAIGDPKVAQAMPRLERALDRAITLIEQTGSIQETMRRARTYADAAKTALGVMPNSDIRHALADIADFCVERAY
jgi:signal transduction histidine kinase